MCIFEVADFKKKLFLFLSLVWCKRLYRTCFSAGPGEHVSMVNLLTGESVFVVCVFVASHVKLLSVVLDTLCSGPAPNWSNFQAKFIFLHGNFPDDE